MTTQTPVLPGDKVSYLGHPATVVHGYDEASPSLRDSGMWCIDTGAWYSLLNPAADEG